MREDMLIPRLKELSDFPLIELDAATFGDISQQEWEVPKSFVERWIALHHHVQGLAENHWEQYVARILGGAAAVGKRHDRSTMRRAVTAAITVLEHPRTRGACLMGRADDHVMNPGSDPGQQSERGPR